MGKCVLLAFCVSTTMSRVRSVCFRTSCSEMEDTLFIKEMLIKKTSMERTRIKLAARCDTDAEGGEL